MIPLIAEDPQGNVNNVLRVTASVEDDAYGGRARASTSATLADEEATVNGHDSTTDLLRGSDRRVSQAAAPLFRR